MYGSLVVRKAVIAIALAAAMLAPAFAVSSAQEISEEHLKAARAAVAASKSTQSLDGILPQLADRAKQQLIANRPDAADQISVIVDDVAISLASRRGDLEDEVARAYARIFTVEELKLITEFYNSEAGQKLVRETPVVARSIEQAARVWSNGIQRDMREQVAKKLQEAGLQ